MSFLVTWLRWELRRRRRPYVVIVLLVTLVVATGLAAAAAARRADLAPERLAQRTLPAQIDVRMARYLSVEWDEVRKLPAVESVAPYARDNFRLPGEVAVQPARFVWQDEEGARTLASLPLLSGRHADPARSDEVVITRGFTREHGYRIGDTVELAFYTAKQLDDYNAVPFGDIGPPEAERFQARIVGEVLSPWRDHDTKTHQIIGTAAMFRHQEEAQGSPYKRRNALVRFRDGVIPTNFADELVKITGRGDVEIADMRTQDLRDQRLIDVEVRLMVLLAAAAGVAMLPVGFMVARAGRAARRDLEPLRTSGLTPTGAALAAAAAPTFAVAIGVAGGVAAAWISSRWTPIGLAAEREPTPGLRFDRLVLLPGGLLAFAVLAVWALAGARLGGGVIGGRRGTRQTGTFAERVLVQVRAPAAVAIGARFGLGGWPGKARVSPLPPLAGAVLGVAGVIGALTLSAGVSDAVSTPARAGQTHQLFLDVGNDDADYVDTAAVTNEIAELAEVAGVTEVRIAYARGAGAGTATTMYSTPLDPSVRPVLFDGDLPDRREEVVLGPATARILGASVGSQVVFSDAAARTFTVSGIGLTPGFESSWDEGAWVSAEGFADVFGASFVRHRSYIAIADAVDVPQARTAVLGAIAHLDPEKRTDLTTAGVGLAPLSGAREVPVALAVFLAASAVLAAGHALTAVARRHGVQIAVLRALGMTPREARLVVATHASVLVMVGLAAGIPLGLLLGRTVWRELAASIPLDHVAPLPTEGLLVSLPVAVGCGVLLSAWPARRVARLAVGATLRAE